MKACVIGGAGFIGRRIVNSLVSKKHEVVALDINPGAGPDTGEVKCARLDVSRFEDVLSAFVTHEPHVVINLSFRLPQDRPRVEAPPRVAFNVNILGMDNCLEAARLSGVGRVVFASSIGIYDFQSAYGDRPIKETDHVIAESPYQYTVHKIFNEWQAKEYRDKHGMCITGIRAGHVAGVDKVFGSVDHVQCIVKPARDEKVRIDYRDWMRSVIHVDDVAEVFARVAAAENPRHAIYNSGGETRSLGEIADMVREVIPDADIAFDHDSGGKEQSRGYIFDDSRVREEFGISLPPYRQRVREMIETARAKNPT